MIHYSKAYPDGSTHWSSVLTEDSLPDGAVVYAGPQEWEEAQRIDLVANLDQADRADQEFKDKRIRDASVAYLSLKPVIGAEAALIIARTVHPKFEAAS